MFVGHMYHNIEDGSIYSQGKCLSAISYRDQEVQESKKSGVIGYSAENSCFNKALFMY